MIIRACGARSDPRTAHAHIDSTYMCVWAGAQWWRRGGWWVFFALACSAGGSALVAHCSRGAHAPQRQVPGTLLASRCVCVGGLCLHAHVLSVSSYCTAGTAWLIALSICWACAMALITAGPPRGPALAQSLTGAALA